MDPRVLVVEADPEARARFRAWLEDAGMWVMTCPGPGGRSDGCPVLRQDRCELVDGVDAIVIDTSLNGEGPIGRGLAVEYAVSGAPVLALSDLDGKKGTPAGNLVVLPREANRRRVVRAVRSLLGS